MKMMKSSLNSKKNLFAIVAVCVALAGCSNMSAREKNTAVGAAVGGAAGAVLTGGPSMGTVGGAVVGGVIGNQGKG